MKLYSKELDFKELGVLGYLSGILGYTDALGLQWRPRLFRSIDQLGMGVLGYSDLLGLGVFDEWLLDLP